MKRFANYLGQLRVYSLADLSLLLVVAGATDRSLLGAIMLHVGFIAYLEYAHKRAHREPVPFWFVIASWVCAFALFAKPESAIYILLSVAYSNKKRWRLGLISPMVRGLQTFVMVGAISGYHHALPLLAMGLMIIRNFLGDLRDAESDAKEGKWTLPAKLRMKSRPFVHLLGMLGTTIAWWLFGKGLPVWLLPTTIVIETATYWLTPRQSNKNAAQWLHNKILQLRR
jgi:hypothetical protein